MRLIAFLAAIAVLFCLTEAGSAQTVYTGMVTTAALSSSQGPTARQAGLRMLTWPGKVQEAPPQRRQAYGAAQHRIWNPEPATPQAAAPAPAPRPQAALPSNIYDPAPPAAVQAAPQPLPPPAPVRQAQAAPPAASAESDYQPPHFYSLYRQYGQTPDPIPASEFDPRAAPAQQLNAQFFAASSPDLAQPPPPVPHTVTTSGGRIMQSAPPSPDDNPG